MVFLWLGDEMPKPLRHMGPYRIALGKFLLRPSAEHRSGDIIDVMGWNSGSEKYVLTIGYITAG